MNVNCCNPLNISFHRKTDYKKLRKMTTNQLKITKKSNKNLTKMHLICRKCRDLLNKKIVYKKKLENNDFEFLDEQKCFSDCGWDETESDSEMLVPLNIMKKTESIENINSCLVILENSPIKKRKLNQKKYSKLKSESVCKTIKESIFEVFESESEINTNLNFMLLEKLKKKFKETSDNGKKI